jgi:hypothetical protein
MRIQLFAGVLFIYLSSVACAGTQWPVVRAMSGTKHFKEASSAALIVAIESSAGSPAYTLECHAGSFEGNSDFNYSGLFHCRLQSVSSKDTLPSLLFEKPHPSSDWEGRARFLLGEVLGDCAKVPDWGAIRTFRLRQMNIQLSISDVSLDQLGQDFKVRSFTFSYDVSPDPAANTSLVAQPRTPEPAWFGSAKGCWPK